MFMDDISVYFSFMLVPVIVRNLKRYISPILSLIRWLADFILPLSFHDFHTYLPDCVVDSVVEPPGLVCYGDALGAQIVLHEDVAILLDIRPKIKQKSV
jgi:hypothetical protein